MPGRESRRDKNATTVFVFVFTLGSGMASITLPLLSLDSGMGPTGVGLAAIAAALVQVITRARLGVVMRYVSSRALLYTAAIAQFVGFAVLLVAQSFLTLTAAWVLQGVARACFWTSGQTHVTHGGRNTITALAHFNFVGGIGQFVGPMIAGVAASSQLSISVVTGTAVAAVAVLPLTALVRHEPFVQPDNPRTTRLLREPGMGMACWGSVGAGTWRSLLDSFVPVVLDAARHSSAVIGVLVSASNAAAIIGALVVGRLRQVGQDATYVWTMVGTGVGMATVGLLADVVVAAAVGLVVAGLGAGMLQTISPAFASASVQPHERGEAIALSGTSRAVAMFGAPLAVTAATAVVPVGVGLLGVGLALCVPAVTRRR